MASSINIGVPEPEDLSSRSYPDIGNYGVIGDCRSAALISKSGCIDWLCWPRFDSPSVFAALLDRERGGYWKLAPRGSSSVNREYVKESNVLQTTFRTASGAVVLTDLMPVQDTTQSLMVPDHEIVRQLTCKSGEVEFETELVPRTHYGESKPQVWNRGKLGIRFDNDHGVYWLRSSMPTRIQDGSVFGTTTLKAGESIAFSLSYTENAPAVLPPLDEVPQRIETCIKWWQSWSAQARYEGEFRDEVLRSALALKLMIFAPSGAIIAAPTTSLPERIGGDLNWDYRFCWLRDSSLTVHALFELGYADEAKAFVSWLLHATRLTQPELRILYDVYGKKPRPERTLDHLAGYGASRPVRVGNGAAEQLQLDVYGEVIHATTQVVGRDEELDGDTRRMLCGFGEYVCRNWQMPDEGIWEPRSGKRHNTHSRLLSWAALDCLLELHRKGHLPEARAASFAANRDLIRRDIETRAWNPRLESYTAQIDGDDLDASLLLLSWHGFEKASSERMRKTYARIREQLGAGRGLLYRYLTGESPGEGAFAVCGFWGAEYLALGGGTLEEARRAFDELCGFANDVGLFAEEIDPATGEGLGNFPQAFTHVGLINAALSLVRRIELEGSMARERMPAPGKVFSEVQP